MSCIQGYIKDTAPTVLYSLLDIADFFRKDGLGYNAYSQHEGLSYDWRDYHKILFKDKQLNLHGHTEYLFIIGGEGIIPVPSMANCMPNKVKEPVPTDILYGYNLVTFSHSGTRKRRSKAMHIVCTR